MKRGLGFSKPATKHFANFADDLQSEKNVPSDPYFPLQWYLRNTGQNGGKVHLDLNVQAAWDQGITGKNVTTAIMDDGTHISPKQMFYFLNSILKPSALSQYPDKKWFRIVINSMLYSCICSFFHLTVVDSTY